MRILRVVLLLVHAFVASRLASGAAVDRYETERQHHTAVINLLDTTRNDRAEPDSAGVAMPTPAEYGDEGHEEDDEEYYDYGDEEDDYGLSGDYEVEVPRVAMSSKPKDPSPILDAEKTEGKRRRGNGKKRGKGKGKGRKRNPCLRKYKNYCIHGTCQFHRELNFPACICNPNYSGSRCEFATLRSRSEEGYNRTTALAVVAVVLSSLCLTIIGLLLALRFHKRGAYDVESEEKVKLGLTPNH